MQGDIDGSHRLRCRTAIAAARDRGPDSLGLDTTVEQRRPASASDLGGDPVDVRSPAKGERGGLAQSFEPLPANPHEDQLPLGELAPRGHIRLAKRQGVWNYLQLLQLHGWTLRRDQ